MNVYFEPQDAESTRFMKADLLPLFQETSIAERVDLKLIPFGRAECNAETQEYLWVYFIGKLGELTFSLLVAPALKAMTNASWCIWCPVRWMITKITEMQLKSSHAFRVNPRLMPLTNNASENCQQRKQIGEFFV